MCIGSVVLFFTACAVPAIGFETYQGHRGTPLDAHSTVYGYVMLLVGWMGALVGQFGWYANFLLLLSWLVGVVHRYRESAWFAIAATLLSLDTLAMYGYPIPADEGGARQSYIESLRPGFFLWEASILLMAGGMTWLAAAKRKLPLAEARA
jgi:hypothetical protein